MSCPPKSKESQSKCGLKTSHSIHYTIAQLLNFQLRSLIFQPLQQMTVLLRTEVQTAGTKRRGREVPDTGVSDAQPGA